MGNPAFDAAMLLRGLRAMDAALGENFNVLNHTCIPSPVVYSSTFPEAGFDFTKYQGIEGLKGTWRGWMYEDGGQGKLKASVHEDVEATVVEAISILERCDDSKDGLITKPEWESCQRGKTADDQLFDLEYLSALKNVTGKLLVLEKDQPLNPVDPDTYPELIQARKELQKMIEAHEAQKQALEQERDAAELRSNIFMGTTIGLGAVVLYLGVRAVLRRRAANRTVVEIAHPAAQVAIRAQQADMADQGMPPAPPARVERRETRVNPPSAAATAAADAEFTEQEVNELVKKLEAQDAAEKQT